MKRLVILINVTKTYLPNKEKYSSYVDEIYKNGWITNNGPMVKRLESRLAEYLGVDNLVLVSNGTVALEIAYRALGVEGYAITTPFSFVATTSSLVTNGIKPIFCDIDPETLNLDAQKLENFITPNTNAIVPVHVFGNACEVERIKNIADDYKLKVIYDAAHAFGVKYKGESLLNYGDAATLSFHATKIFHSIEGGAIVFKNKQDADKARYLINFGIRDQNNIPELGTNAKMNEFEAAMGLCVLDDIDKIVLERCSIFEMYKEYLSDFVRFQMMNENSINNFSYAPVIFDSEEQLELVVESLNSLDIYPRRYFFPSLDTLSYIEPKQYMPISRNISDRILCLPLYYGLDKSVVKKICDVIISIVKEKK